MYIYIYLSIYEYEYAYLRLYVFLIYTASQVVACYLSPLGRIRNLVMGKVIINPEITWNNKEIKEITKTEPLTYCWWFRYPAKHLPQYLQRFLIHPRQCLARFYLWTSFNQTKRNTLLPLNQPDLRHHQRCVFTTTTTRLPCLNGPSDLGQLFYHFWRLQWRKFFLWRWEFFP